MRYVIGLVALAVCLVCSGCSLKGDDGEDAQVQPLVPAQDGVYFADGGNGEGVEFILYNGILTYYPTVSVIVEFPSGPALTGIGTMGGGVGTVPVNVGQVVRLSYYNPVIGAQPAFYSGTNFTIQADGSFSWSVHGVSVNGSNQLSDYFEKSFTGTRIGAVN